MDEIDLIHALEETCKLAARIAAADLREKGIMPFKVRVQMWAKRPDGMLANSEHDSFIDAELYEKAWQEYQQKKAEVEAKIDPLDVGDVLYDVRKFINRDDNSEKDNSGDPSEET